MTALLRAMNGVERMRQKMQLGLGPGSVRSGAGGLAIVSGLEAALAGRASLDSGNTFTGAQDTFEHVHANSELSTDGNVVIGAGPATLSGSLLTDPRTFQFPDVAGTLLVDAPSDGNKYVRKDGAWVLA